MNPATTKFMSSHSRPAANLESLPMAAPIRAGAAMERNFFYIDRDGGLMAVDVTLAPTFTHGLPKELFKTRIRGGGPQAFAAHYDVTPDGRFLIISQRPTEKLESAPITVVLNWQAAFRK